SSRACRIPPPPAHQSPAPDIPRGGRTSVRSSWLLSVQLVTRGKERRITERERERRGRNTETRRHGASGNRLPSPSHRLTSLRIVISIELALEVAEQHIITIPPLVIVRHQRDLSPAARRIDHELRHRVPRGMPAQTLDDLQPRLDRRSEV